MIIFTMRIHTCFVVLWILPAIASSSAVTNIRYVGCYDLTFALRQDYNHPISSVTRSKCVKHCRQVKQTKYAGIEASNNNCYCGDDIAEKSVQRNDTLCNVPCPGKTLRTCGGDHLMSLYDIQGTNAVDTSDVVDFLVGIRTGVNVYHSNDQQAQFNTHTITRSMVFSVDYHLSKNFLFYYSRGTLYKKPLDSQRNMEGFFTEWHMEKKVSSCQGFAVDWVHDRIYWADCSSTGTTIKSMELEGEDEQVVLSRAELVNEKVRRMEIDPYMGIVFWATNAVIQSCEVSGEGFIANMSKTGVTVKEFTLDLQLWRVYYLGVLNDSASLYSMDYTGDNAVEHYSLPQFRSIDGLGIVGGKLYWLNYANPGYVIYTAPLNLTGVDDVKTIITINETLDEEFVRLSVWTMRVMHPSLQRRPRNPCLDKGCVHGCVVHGSTAQCECPRGLELNSDGVSCHVDTHSSAVYISYVGCYDLSYAIRQHYDRGVDLVKLSDCVDFCQAMDAWTAGIDRWAKKCYCGDDIADESVQRNDTLCNVPCRDDPLRTCGGDRLMSLYDIRGASAVGKSGDVDVLVGFDNGVRAYNSANNWTTFDTRKTTEDWVNTVDYHIPRNMLFYSSKNRLHMTKMDPKRGILDTYLSGTLFIPLPDTCKGFAVDWVHDRIYWAACDSNETTIRFTGLKGDEDQDVLSIAEPTYKAVMRMEIDPYKGVVFWIADVVIQSCKVSGEGFIANMTRADVFVKALALDIQLQRVYYVGVLNESASLYSMDYTGNNEVEHYSLPQFKDVYGLSIVDGKVFWLDQHKMGQHAIYEAPANLTRVEDVKSHRIIEAPVSHMRVVHPSLQRRPRVDPCLDKGCVYGSTAQCECPQGQELHTKGVSFRVPAIAYFSAKDKIRYVGCYDHGYSLDESYSHRIDPVTLSKCVHHCRAIYTTEYAGVDASWMNLCYCGNDIADQSVQKNDTLCDVPCPDESLRTCGSSGVMSLYDLRGTSAVGLGFGGEGSGNPIPEDYPCLDKGCVHACVVHGSTAQCECPRGQELNSDGVSCHDTTDDVVVLVGMNTGVRAYNSAGNWTTFDTRRASEFRIYTVDYHIPRNMLFYSTQHGLNMTALDPKRRMLQQPKYKKLASPLSKTCKGFAVDWVHDRIYWANCDSNVTTVRSMGLEGDEDKVVLSIAGPTHKAVKRMEIDPYKGVVFWTADKVIQSCTLSGEGFIANMSKAGVTVKALALDLQLRRVYYVGNVDQCTTSLYSMDYAGGNEVEHYSLPQFKDVYGLSIVGSKVFWVDKRGKGRLHTIYEAPANLTQVEDVKSHWTIEEPVWHMRVVHPSLQRRPRVDPCLDKGCIHGCVVHGSTAQCECPPGQELHPDGVSCHVPAIANSSAIDNIHYVGCFEISYSIRWLYQYRIVPVTLSKCVQYCRLLNTTKYAGVEASGDLCYCGDDIAERSFQRNDTLCNVPCPDESLRTCGGDLLMSLYDLRGKSALDDAVDFLFGFYNGVIYYESSENWTSPHSLLYTAHGVDYVEYHLSKNILFYNFQNVIYKKTLYRMRRIVEPTPKKELLKNPSDYCSSFAVDWVHDCIYWAVCASNGTMIKSMGLEGEAEQVVLTVSGTQQKVEGMKIDPYKGLVFWTATGVIQSCTLSGEGFIANMTKAGVTVKALALDLQLRRVYYVDYVAKSDSQYSMDYVRDEDEPASLYSMDYAGGDVVKHYSLPQFHAVIGLSIVGGKVYWVGNNGNYYKFPGVFYEAPLNLTGVDDVKILLSTKHRVRHMRVVHPSLQDRPRVDPCLEKGCVHACVDHDSTAQCECPPGQELNPDGVSCYGL